MTEGFGVGLVVGLAVAVPVSMLSVLLVTMWQRRPAPVVMAAYVGAATSDAILAFAGIALGSAVAWVVSDAGIRASIAAGLLIAIAARIVLGLLMGPYGVASNAVLPTTVGGAWVRFLVVAIINPTVGVAAVAVAVMRPDLTVGDAWTGLVAGFVLAGLAWRVLWAATAQGRAGVRSAWTSQLGLGVGAILLLAWLVTRLAA